MKYLALASLVLLASGCATTMDSSYSAKALSGSTHVIETQKTNSRITIEGTLCTYLGSCDRGSALTIYLNNQKMGFSTKDNPVITQEVKPGTYHIEACQGFWTRDDDKINCHSLIVHAKPGKHYLIDHKVTIQPLALSISQQMNVQRVIDVE